MSHFMNNHIIYVLEKKDENISTYSKDDYEYYFTESVTYRTNTNHAIQFRREVDKRSKLLSRESFFTMLTKGFKSFDELSETINFSPEVHKQLCDLIYEEF